MKSAGWVIWVAMSLASAASGATLPGFRVESLGTASGFLSSIAIDSRNTIYYTTTSGNLFRLDGLQSIAIAHVNTDANSDSGLLGMALIDDATAVVHYTTPQQTADILSRIDLASGHETVIHEFIGDLTMPGRPCPPEHHGGNPSVAADGSIFVPIGDYGTGAIAAMPDWNAGKIFRVTPAGDVQQFARGFRNPFDTIWDTANQRLIATDNGVSADDEINIVTAGGYYGWPYTVGNDPNVDGATPPIYVFPRIVAPTGITPLRGKNAMLKSGYLVGAFVTKAIYYIPDIDARPLPDPIALINGETSFVIDVAEGPDGTIYFGTGNGIYKLDVPLRGDCNGDGVVNGADVAALELELADGEGHRAIDAPAGAYRGSWGCDANGDGVIDDRDVAALNRILGLRLRSVRSGPPPKTVTQP